MYRSLTLAGLSATLALTACSGSGTSPQKPTTQNLNQNVLQFSVGTANLYGDTGAGFVGLNIATTYRQSKTQLSPGDSAVAVSAPTISGPFSLPGTAGSGGPGTYFSTIATGPAPVEIGGNSITATPQTSSLVTTFGTPGGVSGLGIEPFNFNSDGGTPFSYVPYTVPAYDPPTDTNAFSPEGYPPAFPSTATGPAPAYSEGIDVFAQITPVVGTYTLGVSVPVNPTFTTSKTATLTSAKLLPAFVQALPGLDSNDDGGATFPITLPAGVTEAYVQIIDYGVGTGVSCNGSTLPGPSVQGPTSYTLFVNASGTATLAGNLGVGGAPSICTVDLNTAANGGTPTDGDEFSVQLVGFDYPWYEASYPNSNGNPAPAISGSNGQSDITISSAITYQQVPSGNSKTLKKSRSKHVLSRTHKYNLR